MSSGEYERALEFLFARTTGGVRLGLDRTRALLAALGEPHRRIPCFHVAGTNGKGSTVATIAALLSHQGKRVATYTSPHLIDFRERIVVAGTPISEEAVVDFVRRHLALIEQLGATFFEATTAMAFDHFAREAPDLAVIETGLGGRLDSTNVVDPVAAVITPISLDHMEWLGDSEEKIAREKAGIFKPGRPVVIGEQFPNAYAALVEVAAERGASPVRSVDREIERLWVEESFDFTAFSVRFAGETVEARTGLVGDHQCGNTMTAWLALHAAGPDYAVPLSSLTPALSTLKLPGRFHQVGNVIFDVAHNAHGISRLVSTVQMLKFPRPIVALVGVLADKDWRSMLAGLANIADDIIVTMPPTAPPDRRWNLAEVLEYSRSFRVDDRGLSAWTGEHARDFPIRARAIPNFDAALATATANPGTTLITGSFHTVGDAMSRLQVNPLAR